MAKRESILTVIVSPDVFYELNKIWRYNAEHRSRRQAEAWDNYLKASIRNLQSTYDKGRPVEDVPELRYVVARKRRGADGHILVYQVSMEAKVVTVLHVFHTKQDWQHKL